MVCPPLAGVPRFIGAGMDLLFWPFHPPPVPPPKGDIKWFVHRWRGWPEGPGVDLLFNVFCPPPVPSPKGYTDGVVFVGAFYPPLCPIYKRVQQLDAIGIYRTVHPD